MTLEPNKDDDDIIFPPRPVRPVVVTEEDSEGESKKGGEEESSYSPPWFLPEPGSWSYNPMKGILFHKNQNKQIILNKLNTSQKVIRLLAALENDPELDVDSLIISLQEAAFDCFDKSLSEVINNFSDGKNIDWKSSHKLQRESKLKEERFSSSN